MIFIIIGVGVLAIVATVVVMKCSKQNEEVLVPLSFNPRGEKKRPTKELVDRALRKSVNNSGQYMENSPRGPYGVDTKAGDPEMAMAYEQRRLEVLGKLGLDSSSVAVAVPATASGSEGLVLHQGRLMDARDVPRTSYITSSGKHGTGAGPPAINTGQNSSGDSDTENVLTGHALYDFQAGTEAELNLTAGERVIVLQSGSDGWMQARNMEGKVGLVPSSYVEVQDADTPLPRHDSSSSGNGSSKDNESVSSFETTPSAEEVARRQREEEENAQIKADLDAAAKRAQFVESEAVDTKADEESSSSVKVENKPQELVSKSSNEGKTTPSNGKDSSNSTEGQTDVSSTSPVEESKVKVAAVSAEKDLKKDEEVSNDETQNAATTKLAGTGGSLTQQHGSPSGKKKKKRKKKKRKGH
eukprot:g5098.t1